MSLNSNQNVGFSVRPSNKYVVQVSAPPKVVPSILGGSQQVRQPQPAPSKPNGGFNIRSGGTGRMDYQ